ncbi:MAG TPA: Uma2 family endonuclease [Polyangiaceae bacterium]
MHHANSPISTPALVRRIRPICKPRTARTAEHSRDAPGSPARARRKSGQRTWIRSCCWPPRAAEQCANTYADASLVCGPLITRTVHHENGRSMGDAIVNPDLIVGVLSVSTERYGRDGKFEAYKKLPSFETYVLVSQDERRIEVRTLREGRWEVQIG